MILLALALSGCGTDQPWPEASEACATGQNEACESVLLHHFGVEIDPEDPAYDATIEGLYLLFAWDLGDASPPWLDGVPGDRPTAQVYNVAAWTFEHTVTQQGVANSRRDDTLLLGETVPWVDPLNTPLDICVFLYGYEHTAWLARQAWDNCIWEDQGECTVWGVASEVWGAEP